MHKLRTERDHLESASAKLLELALKAGAETAEVCGAFATRTKISLEKQDFHMASSDDGYSLGVRVLYQGRQGFASCNSCDAKDLKEIATRAVEIARFSPHNPYYCILPNTNLSTQVPTDLWDDALFEVSLHTQRDWATLMVKEATQDPRFRVNEGSVGISAQIFLLLNSLGTHKISSETQAAWSLMGMAVEGQNITSFDYFQELSRKALGTPERIVATSRQFRETILRNLNIGPAESYRGLVAFSPRAVSDMFLSRLTYHLNGRNVVEETSKWRKENLAQEMLHPKWTVRDIPWKSDRFGCCLFDREGTPTIDRALIERGVVKSFLLDGYSARALEMTPTGHAVGSPAAPPTVGAHCLQADGGDTPLQDLMHQISQQQPAFLKVNRFSGQVDAVTGDFSGVAKGAEWWVRGERAYCVKETLISGNLFDVLGKGLHSLSKETEVIDSQDSAPTLFADGISVTAAKK